MIEVGDLNVGDTLKGYSLAGLSEHSDSDFLEVIRYHSRNTKRCKCC